MPDKNPLEELAEALDNHQITDEDGRIIGDQTSTEEAATQETKPAEDDARAEKSEELEESSPEDDKGDKKDDSEEPELVETASDETGKRYVPESRFKEVYGKWRSAERELKQRPKPEGKLEAKGQAPTPATQIPFNRADALEVDVLQATLPQFNPNSPDYNREIDELGFNIYQASRDVKGIPTMTRIQAGREAIKMAKKITSKVATAKSEAKSAKAQQSDQGVTTRVLNREKKEIDPEKMTLEEKEEWLKANNLW